MKAFTWLRARLGEASTWAGLAAIGTAAGVALNAVSMGSYAVAASAAVAGAIAFCKAENIAVPLVLTEASVLLPAGTPVGGVVKTLAVLIAPLALVLSLAACTAADKVTVTADAEALCAVSNDPQFASIRAHNAQAAADVDKACAVAPLAIAVAPSK